MRNVRLHCNSQLAFVFIGQRPLPTVKSFDVASLTSCRFLESVQSSFFSASNRSLNKFASGAIEARPGGSVRSVNRFGLCSRRGWVRRILK